jgi:hypothetical protein
MEIDSSESGKCKLSMGRHTDKILESWTAMHEAARSGGELSGKPFKSATTPCVPEIFAVGSSPPLAKKTRELFHSIVMEIFYVAKRVRPEILVATSYLTTRVLSPNRDDLIKLRRLVTYIRDNRERQFELVPRGIYLEMYVDASHACHDDRRSQSGIVLTLGGAPFYCSSSRQKLNSKSSTESEIIGMSDASSMIQWARQFLQEQGYANIAPAHCWEDNMSALDLWKKGYSTAKETKHIETRHFYMSDLVKRGIIILEHIPTEDQVGDLLTKGLADKTFTLLRSKIYESYSRLEALGRNVQSAKLRLSEI